jgi:DNA-directed RNA polymerase subunit RPC12/RpoP
MLYHKKCGTILRAKLTEDSVKLLATFSIVGKYTAEVKEIVIYPTGLSKIPLSYFCLNCGQTVEDENQIVFVCNSCGKDFLIKYLRIPTESGGIFCVECSKRFEKEEKIYTLSIKDIKI